jgi:hypothetical protein
MFLPKKLEKSSAQALFSKCLNFTLGLDFVATFNE